MSGFMTYLSDPYQVHDLNTIYRLKSYREGLIELMNKSIMKVPKNELYKDKIKRQNTQALIFAEIQNITRWLRQHEFQIIAA